MAFEVSSSMAYKPRYITVADHSLFHVTWQCHNKNWLLKWDWSKQLYYNLLVQYKEKYGLLFYAYHFMENHVHLAGKIGCLKDFSYFFRVVNNLFSRTLNKRLKRRGQAVMDRFLSSQIKDDRHMLAVLAYIDLNGVRSGRDRNPNETRWSSYHFYAYGKNDPLVVPVATYLGLGNTDIFRQQVYRQLVEMQRVLSSKDIKNCSV